MSSIHFTHDVRVEQIDTDLSGAAQIPSWIRWMEETEYAFLRKIGLSVSMRDERGQYGFPRLSAEVEILCPVTFGQAITIGLTVGPVSGKKIEYRFKASSTEGAAGAVLARGRFAVACCRFPAGALPYAILIPEVVIERFEKALS